MATEGGGQVPPEIRDQAKSVWLCFFSGIHSEHDQGLIKEILFWASIYHEKDTLAHIILPQNPRRDFWRRHFGVTSFPALVLADDAKYPGDFIVFSSSFLDQKPFEDPKKLVAVLDFYHDRIVDGYTFNDLRKQKVLKELSKLTRIALKQLTGMVSLSAAVSTK